MKNGIILLLLPTLLWVSCTKQKTLPPLTKAEVKQKVDSIMVVRNKELVEAAKVDLERRMKIEVKVKVDSILNARTAGPATATTLPVINGNPNALKKNFNQFIKHK